MRKTKIVLLGGSNSVIVNGLQKGLRQENIELTNLALGGTDNLQNLFELVQERNQKVLNEADFIVIETNINDSHMIPQGHSLQTIGRNFCWLCEKLYQLNKKVIFLILPFVYDNPALNALLKANANHYGFNVIDIHKEYETQGLIQFYNTTSAYHQMSALMRLVGERIIESLGKFQTLKPNASRTEVLPKFAILSPASCLSAESLTPIHYGNSAYQEVTYKVMKNDKIQFPKEAEGYAVVGVKIWNLGLVRKNSISFVLENHKTKVVKTIADGHLLVHTLESAIKIDEATYFRINTENKPMTESSVWLHKDRQICPDINYVNVVYFYLARGGKWDYAIPLHTQVEVESKYEFSHILPDFKAIKEIIEEYCQRMKPKPAIPQSHYQNTLTGATLRVQSHLAYKLGNAMILNSQSLWGMIRLPYVLSYIKESHKREQKQYQEKITKNPKLKLPPLESYMDYEEALKIKNYTSYKLGEGLIAANRAGGGGQYCFICSKPLWLKSAG